MGGEADMMLYRRNIRYLTPVKWIGTATGIAGALLVALNIGAVGLGFVLFAISSSLWAFAGWVHREMSIFLLQAVFLIIDAVGIYNWLVI
jgi:hypothetical protein